MDLERLSRALGRCLKDRTKRRTVDRRPRKHREQRRDPDKRVRTFTGLLVTFRSVLVLRIALTEPQIRKVTKELGPQVLQRRARVFARRLLIDLANVHRREEDESRFRVVAWRRDEAATRCKRRAFENAANGSNIGPPTRSTRLENRRGRRNIRVRWHPFPFAFAVFALRYDELLPISNL